MPITRSPRSTQIWAWPGFDDREIVIADIPGLIEGAHEGKGIGDRFLGHVERSAVLLHLVDGTSDTPLEDAQVVLHELEAYAPELAERPRVTAMSKVDAFVPEHAEEVRSELAAGLGTEVLLDVFRCQTRRRRGPARAQRGRFCRPCAQGGGGGGRMETLAAQTSAAQALSSAGLVVIKIGSALLVEAGTGRLREDWLAGLAADVAAAKASGKGVILVSSGAIALGRQVLGLPSGPLSLDQSQAAAAVGQIRLARAYEGALAPFGITAAQVLVTLEDSSDRRRYLNSRATIATLLGLGAVPIVNENDTVATDEIRYGDNDRLAAQVLRLPGLTRFCCSRMWMACTTEIA